MTNCCKQCDGWPDEGYCTAQETCACHHTPENPDQEKYSAGYGSMSENPAQEKRVWWPSYADETKKPPIEEAASGPSTDDTDSIHDEAWEVAYGRLCDTIGLKDPRIALEIAIFIRTLLVKK